jgi:hypothetical protein
MVARREVACMVVGVEGDVSWEWNRGVGLIELKIVWDCESVVCWCSKALGGLLPLHIYIHIGRFHSVLHPCRRWIMAVSRSCLMMFSSRIPRRFEVVRSIL